MEALYALVKKIAGIFIDNWRPAIKILVALYFISTGAALLSGAALPNFTVSIPTFV